MLIHSFYWQPSNDTSKSTDTEGVELSDSGALVAPPKVKDVLTGGKRKEGSKPTRRKKKRQKSKSKNDNCRGGARIVDTPLGNGEEQRECLKRALLNAVGTGGNDEGTQTIIAMQLGVTRPSKPNWRK